ncbi:4Fe-4S binding protein [bacterium]|nr:4Fe-4S binding protein [bacterium]
MIRKIIEIDEEKCTGCGLCVPNCVEGALRIIDGKARLVSETYCDGLGACLGECPEGALSIEEREAGEFDEEAVQKYLAPESHRSDDMLSACSGGCPGSLARTFDTADTDTVKTDTPEPSQLRHWPVQLMLVPPRAPFLKGADIVVCADCVPFAVPDFHHRYLKGRAVLVGCPKLDNLPYYREKLLEIFRESKPVRITVLRMEVPCCSGIAHAVIDARNRACPDVLLEVHIVSISGDTIRKMTE